MRSLILAALMAAVGLHVQAIGIVGARSCGAWIANSTQTTASREADRAWLVGFLSGLAIGARKDFLRGIDSDSMYLWIDNYCRANPLKFLDSAGVALAQELIDQKKR